MSLKVCVSASLCLQNKSGGVAWYYLNWALGLQALGCHVIWLEVEKPNPESGLDDIRAHVALLKERLSEYGLENFSIALSSNTGEPLPWDASGNYLSLEEAATAADLLINLAYHSHPGVIGRFRRSVFVDTDPGLMQFWLSTGQLDLAKHDVYFTIGETVGKSSAKFPDMGLDWHYTPLPVYLPAWSEAPVDASAPYTTVSNWWGDWIEFEGRVLSNEKRASFLDYLELPSRSSARLELALTLGSSEADRKERCALEEHGWGVRSLWEEDYWSAEDYREYVRRSRGEFTCMKPFYVSLETAMITDRTLYYLASGKPAIIQYTGPSRFLPDAEGLFRFRSLDEAARALVMAETDYARHGRLARAFVEEYCDACNVVGSVLERAVT